MGIDLIVLVISAVATLVGGAVPILQFKAVRYLLYKLAGKEPPNETTPYTEKLERLTSSMAEASQEMDALLAEFAKVAKERHEAMQKVESELRELEQKEKELQDRIEHLQNVPLPVAEHFAKLTSTGEKRSARRDYLLFGAGVVVSTVIAIILKLVGLG
jgi:septal ring factor EnvC (AmiA/AmiB activator)